MQLTTAGNDMLASLGGLALNHGVRLGQLLESLHKLGQIGTVLHSYSHTYDRGNSELHGLNAAGRLDSGDSARLNQVLVDTNKASSVSCRNISHGLGITSHHDHHALDGLEEKISLLAGHVVRAKDADFLTSRDLSGKDTSEGRETVVVSRNHLGDIHHQRSVFRGVAIADGSASLVVGRSVVKRFGAIGLGLCRRGQVDHNHLKNCVGSWKPLLHDVLQARAYQSRSSWSLRSGSHPQPYTC